MVFGKIKNYNAHKNVDNQVTRYNGSIGSKFIIKKIIGPKNKKTLNSVRFLVFYLYHC